MVTVATGLDVPIKILVPLFLSSGDDGATQFTLIGLGDIVLPGLLLCYALVNTLATLNGTTATENSFLFFLPAVA